MQSTAEYRVAARERHAVAVDRKTTEVVESEPRLIGDAASFDDRAMRAHEQRLNWIYAIGLAIIFTVGMLMALAES